MNFYEIDQLVQNEVVVRQFVEAIANQEVETTPQPLRVPKSRAEINAAMHTPPAGDYQWHRSRGRGVLHDRDPINQWKGDETAGALNIVWITGMWSGAVPGTGRYSELLKPLGYNVRTVRTLSDMKTAGLGRIVRHIPFQSVKNLHSRWAGAHIGRNQEKVTGELADSVPDLIIGSSQGGAVALSIADRYKDTPMILLCPAWKIFNVTPTYLNPESLIIHGVRDLEVPFQDSQELAEKFGVRLVPTRDGHIMKQGMSVLISQLHSVAPMLAKLKRDRESEAEKQRVVPTQEEGVLPQVNLWFA